MIPIEYEKNHGIRNGGWCSRMLKERRCSRKQRGWVFSMEFGKSMKASELESDIFEVLEKVQEETNHIPRHTDVKEGHLHSPTKRTYYSCCKREGGIAGY